MTVRELINQTADQAGELTGTPKQIAWAEKLIDARLDDIIEVIRRTQMGLKNGLFSKEDLAAQLGSAKKIARITRASWWIEQRDNSSTHLLCDEFESNLK